MGRRLLVLTLSVICFQIAAHAKTSQQNSAVQRLKNLPIAFEVNRGQVDPQVCYLARARNGAIFFTPSEVVLALYAQASREHAEVADIRLKWVGGNPSPTVVAENALPGRVNYLVGKDPSRWHTDVPTFRRVRYRGLYNGVDAVFYGKEGTIEYDIVLAPGTDLRKIRFTFEGAQSIRIADNGDLLLRLTDGEVRQELPRVYQEVAGKQRTLAANYIIHGDNTVGYRVQGVDPKRPLNIDPTLSYSTLIGSSTADSVNSVAVDQFGRAYATGSTVFGFPLKNPAQGNQLSVDAFVTKFFATGAGIIYSTILGGDSVDQGNAIAVDRFGNAYVGGNTSSANFPVTAGAFHPQFSGGGEGFVTKLSPSGSSLVYSLTLGGEESDIINALALDSQQRVYVTGGTCSEFFPVKNAFQPNFTGQPCSSGGFDAIVARLNRTGSDLEYSTYLDGHISSNGRGISVDSTFHAYVTGFTSSPDFPTTPGAFQRIFRAKTIPMFPHDIPGTSAFVTKFAANGSSLNYSTFLGGTSSDIATAIAVDGSDRAYVTGVAQSADFPVKAGGFQTTRRGSTDAFVTKMQRDGANLIYSTFLGGNGGDGANSIAVNSLGQAHVAGATMSSSFPVRNPIQATYHGGQDAFVTKLSATGASLIYSTFLGGTRADSALSLRLDSADAAYVGGVTNSTNFPTMPGAYSRTLKGQTDGWVAKIRP